MFGLPLETDLSDLVGWKAESVSVSLHQVNLNLNSAHNISVAIEGDFGITDTNGTETRYSSAPEGAIRLIALLDAEIINASVRESGTTVINFADGTVVSIYDSEPHYESYQIHIGEQIIVV